MNIDEILESGDPEAMAALLDSADATDDGELSVTLDEPAVDPRVSADAEADAPVTQTPAEDSAPRVILSKDGKHQIPYEVLENSRSQVSEYRTQAEQHAAEAATLKAQLEETTRLLTVRSDQLKANAIDPKHLPEAMKFSDEKLQQIEEEYGELGETQVALIRQLQAMQANMSQSQSTAPAQQDPTETAIQGNPDLTHWRSQDPDRFDFAVSVDNKLRQDPNFADKSLSERFAEVTRRTKAAFGDPAGQDAQHAAQAVINAATPTTPRSLTDVSASSLETEKPLIARLAEQGVDDIALAMQGMTDAQIDALLEQGYI